jgi:hypothetical protein
MLLVGFNFFSLGHELRTAFASLLDTLYLGAYPHDPLPHTPKAVHYVNFTPPTPVRGPLRAHGASVTALLPRFSVPGYDFALHPNAQVRLAQGKLAVAPWARDQPSDAFLLRACFAKFDLLAASLVDALGDERLLAGVAASVHAWQQEQGS